MKHASRRQSGHRSGPVIIAFDGSPAALRALQGIRRALAPWPRLVVVVWEAGLVLLSWPVHEQWFPDFTKVQRVIDVRVRLNLIILADRGGQTLTPPPEHAGRVSSHVNGWFERRSAGCGRL